MTECLISFICPIMFSRRYGLDVARVEIPITILGSKADGVVSFVFDSGCGITIVSEDVANALGLPQGGRTVTVIGATSSATGRLVSATFRFPPDFVSGSLEPAITSTWIVIANRTKLALLSLQEVHRHFTFSADDTDMYFTNR